MKPHSEACERNQDPILAVLRTVFGAIHSVLEIGSGTGQHAVHFGGHLRHLLWQTSDLPGNHDGIREWITGARLSNVMPPLTLDVCGQPWPIHHADAVYTANTLHIISLSQVECLFEGAGKVLGHGAPLCTYGPFTDNGRHTSPSNEAFDAMLRNRDPESGIRDLRNLGTFADNAGLDLSEDHLLPANNRLLVWRRR